MILKLLLLITIMTMMMIAVVCLCLLHMTWSQKSSLRSWWHQSTRKYPNMRCPAFRDVLCAGRETAMNDDQAEHKSFPPGEYGLSTASFTHRSPPRWPSGKGVYLENGKSGFESRLQRDFSRSSHTSDLKIGTPVATLPGAWSYRVSVGTGRRGVGILCLGEVESFICNFCLIVAARNLIRPWDTLACCWDVKQPTNNNNNPHRSSFRPTVPQCFTLALPRMILQPLSVSDDVLSEAKEALCVLSAL